MNCVGALIPDRLFHVLCRHHQLACSAAAAQPSLRSLPHPVCLPAHCLPTGCSKGLFPEDHPNFIGLFWSEPGRACYIYCTASAAWEMGIWRKLYSM